MLKSSISGAHHWAFPTDKNTRERFQVSCSKLKYSPWSSGDVTNKKKELDMRVFQGRYYNLWCEDYNLFSNPSAVYFGFDVEPVAKLLAFAILCLHLQAGWEVSSIFQVLLESLMSKKHWAHSTCWINFIVFFWSWTLQPSSLSYKYHQLALLTPRFCKRYCLRTRS